MQSVSSRIWTRVSESISCEDNHYTTGTYLRSLSDEYAHSYGLNITTTVLILDGFDIK